ncbi:hypothetical protein JXJ21_04740 [candidate division KSB1 bacterium]|nr:hypothetical protein [candidate division KSB1 bacterium]
MTETRPVFSFQQTGAASGVIFDRGESIAEIRELQLCNIRFQRQGALVIGESVRMPLFWWQYAGHENPDRNTGSNGKLEVISQHEKELQFRCSGMNQSRSALSEYVVNLTYSIEHRSYCYHIRAKLTIPRSETWRIAPNPAHGELEFCNLSPLNSFPSDMRIPKKYQACYVRRGDRSIRIPHHHLETEDKHNIRMNRGDRFYWLLEDINPVVEMDSKQLVQAGVCAYMWDAHFAYRVTDGISETCVQGERQFEAEFQLYAIDRATGSRIAAASELQTAEVPDTMPIYVDGLNTFEQAVSDYSDRLSDIWSWTFRVENAAPDAASAQVDRGRGFERGNALMIENYHTIHSHWIITTLGPAFRQPPFQDGARYRLSAVISTENVSEATDIAIRLHRPGYGNVFDVADYEIFVSRQSLSGNSDWRLLQLTTPPIAPAPDRLHLMLRQSGSGKSWFSQVLFEQLFE